MPCISLGLRGNRPGNRSGRYGADGLPQRLTDEASEVRATFGIVGADLSHGPEFTGGLRQSIQGWLSGPREHDPTVGALTYRLGVKLTDAINVEFYTDVEQTLPDPVLLAPMLDTESIAGRQLLVVDDVADSGRTLSLVVKLLRGFGADVRSAVLYAKPTTIVNPDFCWRRTGRNHASPGDGDDHRRAETGFVDLEREVVGGLPDPFPGEHFSTCVVAGVAVVNHGGMLPSVEVMGDEHNVQPAPEFPAHL